jgi:hypothetical protein
MELEEDAYYNPVSDPMKISNLDHDLLPALREGRYRPRREPCA